MRYFTEHRLIFIPSILYAVEKGSIFIDQFVKDSFKKYGIRSVFMTVMSLGR